MMKLLNYIGIGILSIVLGAKNGNAESNDISGGPTLQFCEDLLEQARNRNVKTLLVPDLEGRWVSSSCETRPGPQFVLRSYDFHTDGSFLLRLYAYQDSSCAVPAFTVVAEGVLELGRPSWVTPGGTDAEYSIKKVTVWPHSETEALRIAAHVNSSCSKNAEEITAHQPYTLLKLQSPNSIDLEFEDCFLDISWHELQLVRVEEMGSSKQHILKYKAENIPSVRELFLGDLHTDVTQQFSYRPTAYQQPLKNILQAGRCNVCKIVGKASEVSPPRLSHSPEYPLDLSGSWASFRCEVQPQGMFLTRIINFSPHYHKWRIQQQYYKDPACTNPTFTLIASGVYTKSTASSISHDFKVLTLSVTPESSEITSALNNYKKDSCGKPGKWKTGISYDVTLTGGCKIIGVTVPRMEKQILKTSIGEEGMLKLYLGQIPTWTSQAPMQNNTRPTAWTFPLQKCVVKRTGSKESNEIAPLLGARTSSAYKFSPIKCIVYALIMLAVY